MRKHLSTYFSLPRKCFENPAIPWRRGARITSLCVFLLVVSGAVICNKFWPHLASTTPQDKPLEIKAGTNLDQEISSGFANTFHIQLLAGQYVNVLLIKGDLHLSANVLGPHGESNAEHNSKYYETMRISFVSQQAGEHRLVIRSLEKVEGKKNYQLKLEALRNSTDHDRKLTAATQAANEAARLRLVGRDQEFRNAIAKYQEVATLWQSAGQLHEVASTLESIGDIYFGLSEFDRALDHYVRARAISRRLRDRKGEMRELVMGAYVHVSRGENQQALRDSLLGLDYYFQDRPRVADAERQRGEADALNAAGEAYYSLGELRNSINHFNRALPLYKAAGDRSGEALARRNLGYANFDSGDLLASQNYFREALALYTEIDDRHGEALALTGIGSVESIMGKKQMALDHHTRAMNMLRVLGNREGEAVALNSIAKAYEDLNDLGTALDNYDRALQIYQERGNRFFEAVTRYYLGRIHTSLGNKERALEYYQQSLLLSRRLREKRITAYALTALSGIRSSEGKTKEALRELADVLALYRKLRDRRGQANTLIAMGNARYLLKENHKALRLYKEALSLSQVAGDRKCESDTLYHIARAARDSGALPEALSALEEAIKIIESLRSQVVSPELRSSYFASVNDHWELYIDLLMKMHWLNPDKGFAAQAFQARENAHARALLELLSEASTQIRQGVDPDLLERERELQQQLTAKAAYQMRLLGRQPDPEEVEETAKQLRQLTTAYQEVQTQIKQRSPRFAALVQPQPLKVDEIQAELADRDTVLLEYSLGDERSFLWLVTAESITPYELPGRTSIETKVRRVYELLTARQTLDENSLPVDQDGMNESDIQYWKEATMLSEILLGPVASQLGSKRLIIVADGALHYLPFEALPSPKTNRDSENFNANPDPLILDHEIVALPSVSILAAIRRAERRTDNKRKLVAILADPVFQKDDPRLSRSIGRSTPVVGSSAAESPVLRAETATGFTSAQATFPRLAATRQEANAIIAETPRGQGMLATDFEASRATAMSGKLAGYSVVHLATHGVIDTEHPELSGIVLSLLDREGKSENGFLQIHDIYNLNLPDADLVVLSACRTGLGKEIRREGLVGLTRGFMYAGSRSVVASLWKVDDRATAELMKYFYQGMFQERLTPSAALQKAKVKMWNQRRWRAPYFWAAFILQGEYKNQISVPPPGYDDTDILITVLFFAVLATIGVIYLRSRKASRL